MALNLKLLKEAAGKAAYHGKTRLSSWWSIVNQNFIDVEDAHNSLESGLREEIQQSHDALAEALDSEKSLRVKRDKDTMNRCNERFKPVQAVQIPSLLRLYDFISEPWFVAKNRCSVEVKTNQNLTYQSITTAANTGNAYAYATFDLSAHTKNKWQYTIEFDSKIGRDRWIIELGDLSKRPGTSNKNNYDSTGVVYTQGTKTGVYYNVNNKNINQASLFDEWVHTRLEINTNARTIKYTITSRDGDYILTETVDFLDTKISSITGLAVYSWTNNTEACITNISFTTPETEQTYDPYCIYIVRENGHYCEYIYTSNGIPIKLGDQTHAITEERISRRKADELLGERIAELETSVSDMASDTARQQMIADVKNAVIAEMSASPESGQEQTE